MPLLPLADLAHYFPGVLDLPGRLAPRSLEEYRRDAQLFLAWCGHDVARVHDPAELKAWVAWMTTDADTAYSPLTINRRLVAIKTLARHSARIDGFDEAAAFRIQQLEPVSVPALRARMLPVHALTREQVRALVRAPDAATLIGVRDRALLHVLASSGVRIAELVSLRAEDVMVRIVPGEGESCMLRVIGKGQARQHLAPLSTEAKAWIDRWLQGRAEAGVDVQWLFTAFAGSSARPLARPLARLSAWARVKRYGRQVGLPWLQPRDFRRFVATAVSSVYGLRHAQLALRHRSVVTTATHYLTDALKPGLTDGLF